MSIEDERMRGLRLPNTLDLPPSHTAAVVGHFLKRIYSDILSEDQPHRLAVLIERLEAAEQAAMRASQR